MISSAVVIPDEPQHLNGSSDQPTSLKRRQSSASISSESNKRPRLDAHVANIVANSPPPSSRTDGSPATRNGAEAMSPPRQPEAGRRKSSQTVEQDKSRNRRLFGAVLGTLSQSSRPSKPAGASATSARNSRRDEIENRQRERLKRENEEVAELARRKKGELDLVRRSEQMRWDEEGMKMRHRNLRASSRFLRTSVEPRLVSRRHSSHQKTRLNLAKQYYKPWELREKEEDTIKRQVEEAEDTIREELNKSEAKRANGLPEDSEESRSQRARRYQDTDMNDEQSRQKDNVQEGQDDGALDNQTVSKGNEQHPTAEADQSEPAQDGQTTELTQEAEDTAPRPVRWPS